MHHIYTLRNILVLLLAVLFSIALSGCSGESKSATPETSAYKIFKEAKNDNDGIVNVAFFEKQETMPARMNITYQYYPLGKDLKREIGVNMASKIKKLYETVPEIDETVFTIQLPYQDKYGNTTWKKSIQFTFTRDIYEKVNWDDFTDNRLLDIAENITTK
ncbi:MAG: hypothetical protein M0P69_17340 [Bacteroidales bacterium]|nr:hypothetical protein [Bacteroidales bacterium]